MRGSKSDKFSVLNIRKWKFILEYYSYIEDHLMHLQTETSSFYGGYVIQTTGTRNRGAAQTSA